LYGVDAIDFSLSPKSEFEMKDGSKVSYMEYYEKKYNKKLNYPQQPLLINKRKKDGAIVHLVPELCVLTGQSDDMRQNFTLQKDLNRIIKPNPQKRLEESQKLLSIMNQNERTKDLLKKWSISTELDPLKLNGLKLDAGNLVMGKDQGFSIENTHDFDRKIQTEMFKQQPIQRIGIFYPSRDREALTAFMDTFEKCVDTFNYPMGKPREFAVDGRNFSDWEKVFKKELNPSVQAVVLLLPGRKKASPFYDDCKRFLLTQCPIPSQVVLTQTITAGKNLRSIINKILIQICAKVGGSPWTVNNFPLTDKPTSVIGIDVFHRTSMKSDSLLAFCATMDRYLSRYWSTIDQHGPGEELGKGIQTAVKNSLLAFKETNNGRFPQRLIVFRDGVSDSQRKTLKEIEVKAFLRAFDDLVQNHEMPGKPEFIFICTNKKVGCKFFAGDTAQRDGLKNPEAGTVVTEEITSAQDFYLISQKTTQGSASPTHYHILSYFTQVGEDYVENTEAVPEQMKYQIELLTYKLCYMYYNWSGSIRVPAPIQYAHKLSNLIGDRWKPNQNMIPHKAFESYKSLYFI